MSDPQSETPETDTHQDAERRLIITLSIIIVVAVIGLGALFREIYYATYPHLRPQAAVSAGTIETCDHDCALRRVRELENKLEGKR